MKRIRTIQSQTLFEIEPTEPIKRQRRPIEKDGFLERFKDKPPLDIIEEFLLSRKQYVMERYPENHQIVLFELNLYFDVLQRIKKGILTKQIREK